MTYGKKDPKRQGGLRMASKCLVKTVLSPIAEDPHESAVTRTEEFAKPRLLLIDNRPETFAEPGSRPSGAPSHMIPSGREKTAGMEISDEIRTIGNLLDTTISGQYVAPDCSVYREHVRNPKVRRKHSSYRPGTSNLEKNSSPPDALLTCPLTRNPRGKIWIKRPK